MDSLDSAWMLISTALVMLISGKPSMLGGASGAVEGLVAVTPAAGASGLDIADHGERAYNY
jgi:Amt family ammonium transporter